MSQNQNLMREVRLYENHAEREQMENFAELYAILNALEHLEKMNSRDHVPAEDYKKECHKLLDQYKLTMLLVPEVTSIEEFAKKYRLHCPAAIVRVREGKPIEFKDGQEKAYAHVVSIAEQFITFLDALRLNNRAVDDLYPGLEELYNVVNTSDLVPIEASVSTKVKKWHDRLSSMAASDEISDDDARQMIFDIESAYTSFSRALKEIKH